MRNCDIFHIIALRRFKRVPTLYVFSKNKKFQTKSRPNMSEKLLTGTLNNNQINQSFLQLLKLYFYYCYINLSTYACLRYAHSKLRIDNNIDANILFDNHHDNMFVLCIPLTTNFYIVKLVFTGVYIIFLFLL